MEVHEIKIANLQANMHIRKAKAMLLLLDGIFRTIEGASVKQLQTSLWQISGALTRSSNRSYCEATAANKHGARQDMV